MDTELKTALEERTKAFEDFKRVNEEKLKASDARAKELEDSQKKIAGDMAEAKKIIEALEAKAKRPQIGVDGKVVDEKAKEHADAFRGYIRKGAAFDQERMEYQAGISVKSLLGQSSGADGGYAIPKVIDGTIDATIVNVSPIRAIASVQQVSTPDFHKLVNKHGTSSGWVGETAARTSTNTPTLVDINPPMGELYAFPQATQQMMDDVFFNADQWLADEIALEFARAEGAAFVSGSGVNQPMGFTSVPTAATADATRAFGTLEYTGTGSSGAFKTLTSTVNPADDLFTLVSKLKKGYRAGASWVMNKATLFQIMGFKDYQGRYVFNPTTAPGVEDTILGYPVAEAEDMPTYSTASALAVAFGNFRLGYLIVDRIGRRVIRDPFSNKPYIGFYVTQRIGGAVINSEAIKFLKFA